MKTSRALKTSRARLMAVACALAGSAVLAVPAAQANSAAVDYFRNKADRTAVPSLLTQEDREYYRDVFSAIERKDWSRVQSLFQQRPDGPLHPEARAEYYLAAGSPRIEGDALASWLTTGRELPQAENIGNLAAKRGVTSIPALPDTQRLRHLPSMPRRVRPGSIDDGTMPREIGLAISDRIKNDDPRGARTLLDGIESVLSPAARTEWRQRVAWGFYIENDDASAYASGQLSGMGTGPWAAVGWWTAGLAAWRLGDCQGAGEAFEKAAARAENPELGTAALYWQSRAYVRCRQPEKAAGPLRAAARQDETLYGMLASEQLGLKLPQEHSAADFTQNDWRTLRNVSNVRIAVGLAEIGEDGLADEVLRHQARIGSPSLYQPLSRLARDLGLPSTQLWMARNAPSGGRPEPASRFPTPKWTPVGGWKVDPALVYAHALQESRFRTSVVSPAGARGLMQIMPAAARDHAGALGVTGNASDLNKPEVNLAFGQRHLEMLRNAPGTQGLLPKVMAAYNAGLSPVTRWNSQINDQGDPLLWMESIPYWETRGYVNIVLRNYWMYERQAGGPSESRIAITQGMWPTFPGLSGGKAVRMAENGVIRRAR